jgi:hypothetical protein
MQTKTTAKDFFLHLGAMVALYAGTVALLNLLFQVINTAYPLIDRYFFGTGSISLPVATLIVVFPLYLFLANVIRKGYDADPARKEFAIRKWLVWITLFVAGIVLAGDLVTLLYYFLDGRELTTGFILKVLSVLVVTGGIFGYYLDDLRERLTGKRRNMWRVFATILVLGSIILGFSVIGSPKVQRLMRYDEQRTNDLNSIQWNILNYWQQKGRLPANLSELKDPISGSYIPVDPQTGAEYTFRSTGNTSFELCANFSTASRTADGSMARSMAPKMMGMDENWVHGVGTKCFTRTIDPELYPPLTKPVR